MTDTWQIVFSVAGILVGILILIFVLLMVVKPPPKKPTKPAVVWHQLPPWTGDRTMPCCGLTPEQVPMSDKIIDDPQRVTCGRGSYRPKRAAA